MAFSKFGISYNIFDGEELLKDSILQIREFVDYISVVYQTKSNWGSPCSDTLMKTLNDLKEEGLVDDLVEYTPINGTHVNEINKRNIGVLMSRKNYCTHHMTIDCDEFYDKTQFKNLIDYHKKNPTVLTYCGLVNYYKNSDYQILKKDDTHVTLFFPIKNNNTMFSMSARTPVLIDPTRKPNYDRYEILSPEFIIMHHMTMVRSNISSKLLNSSARTNYNNQQFIENIINCYDKFDGTNLNVLITSGEVVLKKINEIVKLENYNKL